MASLLVARQGVSVTCLHYYSPFFGKPHLIPHWQEIYGLNIVPVNIGESFVRLLQERPKYGFGKILNPCVDCKILMISHAKTLLEQTGACCIVSGEVLGQRPMSQRKETLNIIRRDADVKNLLLRPLSALHLDPTLAEEQGIIDRSQLRGFFGRGRKLQLELAKELELKEIPTPAGGCRLTEAETSRSYWPILENIEKAEARDFFLANCGRQAWKIGDKKLWLTIGRNQADNDQLLQLAKSDDILFKVQDFTGPIALGRQIETWSDEDIQSAAALMVSYSSKAMQSFASEPVKLGVRVHLGSLDSEGRTFMVKPEPLADGIWHEPAVEAVHKGVKQINKGIQEKNRQ